MDTKKSVLNKSIVFLSIKEHWAIDIINGKKKYEYRRQPPSLEPPYYVLLYVTGDKSAIIGAFETESIIKENIIDLINKTINDTPHKKEDTIIF